MSRWSDRKLLHELQMMGAGKDEQHDLVAVAQRLRTLQPARSAVGSHESRRIRWASAAAAAVITLTALTLLAQASLPGSRLYPIKRTSENAALAVVPSYHATLMMRRADEVRRLIAMNASTKTVQSTLRQYQTEAAAYKGSNYPAFEYCKHSLQQAQTSANPTERQLIASVLQHLGDIH
ncbi:MAG TPA: hypothetical protein VLF69_01320 [Candidatus Saccharimonadales bacterium]|nr:hypothetical protein [Candidatus Saccharimonadales bacterium]